MEINGEDGEATGCIALHVPSVVPVISHAPLRSSMDEDSQRLTQGDKIAFWDSCWLHEPCLYPFLFGAYKPDVTG